MSKWKFLVLLALLGAGVMPSSAEPKKVEKPVNAAHVFKQQCASCHAEGGNRIKPSRPLAGSKQLVSLANFKSYLANPPGHMPYYQNLVNDKKMLEALYTYCKSLKKAPKQA